MSVSANLCDSAARDHSVIVIDENTYKSVSARVIAEPLEAGMLGKASNFTSAAYEVAGIR